MVWDKLDEIIGGGMLTGIAVFALYLGADHGIAQMCVTGIIAMLAAKAVVGKKLGGEK